MQTEDSTAMITLYSLLCVLLNTTLWQIANKYRVIERYQLHRRLWMPAEPCVICISFWVALAYSIPVAAYSGHWVLLLGALISCGVTAKIQEK